jgi:hypothetical protein
LIEPERQFLTEIPVDKTAGHRSSRGFPLFALFLLVALFAVVAAQLSWLATGVVEAPWAMGTAAALGGASGLVFGLMIGLYHFRRIRGALIGMATGLVFGAMTGTICNVAIAYPWATYCMSMAGGVTLVGIAMLYRAVSSDDPVSKSLAYAKLLKEHNATESHQ